MERFEKLQSSLPFNLDEAAEEYAPDFSNSIASKAAVDAIRDAFKAGAQWQKQQNDLETKKVDLEKEIIRVSKNEYFDFTDWKSIARHFYELGLKSQKEE